MTINLSERVKALILSFVLLFTFIGIWEFATPNAGSSGQLSEYEMLTGGGSPQARVPPPSQIFHKAVEELSQPFYDNGPNDKGIGIQLAYSLYRVLTGYFLAALIAIPVGFLIGMSPLLYKALDPFIQILRPISPLA